MDDYDEAESQVSPGSKEGGSSSLAELAEEIESTTLSDEESHEGTLSDHADDTDETVQKSSMSDLADSVREKRRVTGEHPERDRNPSGWSFTDGDSDPVDAGVELDSEAIAVLDRIKDETNVLLVGPSTSGVTRALCERLMAPDSPSEPHRQLVVSVDTPLDDQRELLQTIRHGSVEAQVLIDAQSYSTSSGDDDYDDVVKVLNVTTPRDVRRIGILTTKVLREWGDTEVPSTVCVHTLSALLDAVDNPKRVFRFVHILHGRVRSAGARSLFYLDPSHHDQQTIRTFFSLFDTILEFDADGTVTLL